MSSSFSFGGVGGVFSGCFALFRARENEATQKQYFKTKKRKTHFQKNQNRQNIFCQFFGRFTGVWAVATPFCSLKSRVARGGWLATVRYSFVGPSWSIGCTPSAKPDGDGPVLQLGIHHLRKQERKTIR